MIAAADEALGALTLFASMLALLELGGRLGALALARNPDATTGTSALEGAVFALLGLLLAFTFFGAASRFDDRRKLIVDETNAIDKVHLDGYNNLAHWTGKSEKSARREYFYYDETDLMALRVDAWKMHIGAKQDGIWWNPKEYPSVPYLFNLLMDPMEKMDQQSHEFGSAARRFFASKMWALNSSAPFIATHLKSLMEYPPSQGADTLGMKKALDDVMKKLEAPHSSSN